MDTVGVLLVEDHALVRESTGNRHSLPVSRVDIPGQAIT
jgi:hypothetical protein